MRHVLIAAAFATLLAACGGDKDGGAARRADGSKLDALPTPEGARGSVTGMPDEPGPGRPADNASIAADSDMDFGDEDVIGGLDEADVPEPGDEAPNMDGEPTAEDAVEAVQRYYAAIESRDFASAYAHWSDAGRSSGQTPEQFAAGFADVTGIIATADAPVRVEGAAAGSRYIEVPVAVETTSQDGRVRRFVGAYTLRRSVVDGATPEQRAWHIASADLRELTQ